MQSPVVPGSASNPALLRGAIHGGQQPVSGATIQLYAAGASDGSSSIALLNKTVTSGADGSFSITGAYSCPAGAYVYLTATGGNPGIGTSNANLALMAAIGACSSLTSSTFIQVNEVTTVAGVSALAPYMSSPSAVASSDSIGLAAAFTLASELANTASGTAPGAVVPSGATVPVALIDTLADIISVCVNSAGGVAADGSACGNLFTLTAGGSFTAPANTIAALLQLAYNPTANAAALFGLVPGAGPFLPTLTTAPASFSLNPSWLPATPAVQISPASVAFPATPAGTAAAAQTITLQNSLSSQPISLSAIKLAGINAGEFSQTNNCPASLAFNNACTVQVSVTPTALGAQYAYLVVESNSFQSPQYVPLSVNNPLPSIGSLNPSSLAAGATSPTTILLIGSNLLPSSFVQVNNSYRQTTYLSSTELTFQLTVADQALATHLSITVVNPVSGGGTSAPATLLLTAPTPTPSITQLFPSQLLVSSTATYIEVVGANLGSNSSILWNGTALATTQYYSSYYGYYLYGIVPASFVSAPTTATITVITPSSSPSTSNALTISVINPPPPTLTSISPGSGPLNTAAPITLFGTNFSAASTVALNGVTIPSTYVGATELTATIPASSLLLPGNVSLTVTTPAPGGGTTAPIVFTAYIPIVNNNSVYNPLNGLIYVSVPGSAGSPLGNSIVSVNPTTGALGTPIFVGSEPDKLALTADGLYLWVSLDGSAAVCQVNLTTNKVGLQFSLPANNVGWYNPPPTIQSLTALPGADNSVVVSATNGTTIFDSGVVRGATVSPNFFALQANGSRNEIYGGSSGFYNTYTYSSSGLTALASNSSISPANASYPEMELAAGKIYTDFGTVYDAEAGTLLGTLYASGTTAAQGATYADTTLGKIFVADNSSGAYYGGINQIQVFNLSTYTTGSTAIPVNVSSASSTVYPDHMVRWGANGLAFRTPAGIYSVQSNLVNDESTTLADLGVALGTSGSAATGGTTLYTATLSNAGPATATDVVLTAQSPATGSLVSVLPSQGSCTSTGNVACSLGSLASGATATVKFSILQTSAGTSTLSAQVLGSTTDTNTSNNSASATVAISGNSYNLAPTVTAISPASIESGATATVITVTGTNFSNTSSILLGGSALPTTYVGPTQLSAAVPATALSTLGWTTVGVSNPAPGGGTSGTLPLTIFSVIPLGVNHILYDPYSRQIMASVGSGSSSIAGNSIAAINPATAVVGPPVPIGSQPTKMALSDDGQVLYSILLGSSSVARYNMLTATAGYTYAVPNASSYFGVALRDIAVQTGSENTIALDLGEDSGNIMITFNPANQSAATVGSASGSYTGSCLQFLNASNLYTFDIDTTGSDLIHYTVSSSGLSSSGAYSGGSTLFDFGCFKINGGVAFANAGGIANPATFPATQIATLPLVTGGGTFSNLQALAPDVSLQRAFYPAETTASSTLADGIAGYSLNTYQPTNTVPLNMQTIEGSTSYTFVDLIRWGQDGLAVLTSGGHIYLLRGPAVVPSELTTNSAAVLTSSSSSTIAHGSGNTLLTITGSNFLPGVGILWNGSYRTTTIVDAAHVTVAIPASDLATTGTASLTAVNPGAAASNAISLTIN